MAISEQVTNEMGEHECCISNGALTNTNTIISSSNKPSGQSQEVSHVFQSASKKHAELVPFLSSSSCISTNTHHHQLMSKIPVGDGPYVRAKRVQLLEKDPERAVALFWAAINAGDRVDSALKDMAIVMKQQNRAEEAIEAVLSFRHLCPQHAQESLDNVLLDLYKKCGRLDDQIKLLKHKLTLIYQGMAFNGKQTKTARSQGRKFQISIRQEATRLLGNLGWAYMQLCNYIAAEAVYRKALSIERDNNKLCNLGVCLMKQHKYENAMAVLQGVTPVFSPDLHLHSDSQAKSYERAQELLKELQRLSPQTNLKLKEDFPIRDDGSIKPPLTTLQEFDLWTHWKLWEAPSKTTSSQAITNPSPLHQSFSLNCAPKLHHDKAESASKFKREISPPSALHRLRPQRPTKISCSTYGVHAEISQMEIQTGYCWPLEGHGTSDQISQNGSRVRKSLLPVFLPAEQTSNINGGDDDDTVSSHEDTEWFKYNEELQSHKKHVSFYPAQGQETSCSTPMWDFRCVDRATACIVPDAPSANGTPAGSAHDDRDGRGDAEARIHANDDDDDIITTHSMNDDMPGDGPTSSCLLGVQQRRLSVFQEMTELEVRSNEQT